MMKFEKFRLKDYAPKVPKVAIWVLRTFTESRL
jgi:hypothetical protein